MSAIFYAMLAGLNLYCALINHDPEKNLWKLNAVVALICALMAVTR